MAPTPHRNSLLFAAGVLYAVVLALRFAVDDPGEAIAVLFVMPSDRLADIQPGDLRLSEAHHRRAAGRQGDGDTGDACA